MSSAQGRAARVAVHPVTAGSSAAAVTAIAAALGLPDGAAAACGIASSFLPGAGARLYTAIVRHGGLLGLTSALLRGTRGA